MSQDKTVLCEFFRWIIQELKMRLTPAEFADLIAELRSKKGED